MIKIKEKFRNMVLGLTLSVTPGLPRIINILNNNEKKLAELQSLTGMSYKDCVKRLQGSLFTISFTIDTILKTGEWPIIK